MQFTGLFWQYIPAPGMCQCLYRHRILEVAPVIQCLCLRRLAATGKTTTTLGRYLWLPWLAPTATGRAGFTT